MSGLEFPTIDGSDSSGDEFVGKRASASRSRRPLVIREKSRHSPVARQQKESLERIPGEDEVIKTTSPQRLMPHIDEVDTPLNMQTEYEDFAELDVGDEVPAKSAVPSSSSNESIE